MKAKSALKRKVIAEFWNNAFGSDITKKEIDDSFVFFVNSIIDHCPNCVSRFDEDATPTFRQGAPKHELEDYFTAEHAYHMVRSIEELRGQVACLSESLLSLAKKSKAACKEAKLAVLQEAMSRYTRLNSAGLLGTSYQEVLRNLKEEVSNS